MRLIKPYTEILEQKDLFKHIELCGRVAYKSENKITEDSATKFVENIKNRKHGAVLEHGTIYLIFENFTLNSYNPDKDALTGVELIDKYLLNAYSKVNLIDYTEDINFDFYITTNYRVLVENDWLDDLQYQCECTKLHEKRISVKLVCDRGVSHELVRSRIFSFVQESTRFCNYSKDKFGNELTFIIPNWTELKENSYNYGYDPVFYLETENTHVTDIDYVFLESLALSESNYLNLIDQYKCTPQQARNILPNALKTEIIMTGFVSDWKQFFELRCAKDCHPQMLELTIPLREEFIKLGYEV